MCGVSYGGSDVMSIWTKLFGSDKVIDSGIKVIDSLILTDEESRELKIKLMQAYEPFKIAQRYFMIIVTVPYMLAWFVTFAASFFAVNLDAQMKLLTESNIVYIVMTICVFYFGDTIAGKFTTKTK